MLGMIDPAAGAVIRAPDAEGAGHWAGAPGAYYDGDEGATYLCYRLRRPRGAEPDRGFEARIARSSDGIDFNDVLTVTKSQFDSPSIEKCALMRGPDGAWHYFVSYVDGQTGRWRIDRLSATSLDGLDPGARTPVFTADVLGLEGAKDPWIGRTEAGYVMLFSAAQAVAATSGASHETADIYNTGECLSVSCLATSPDLANWTYEGVVLAPVPGQWDAYCARLNGAIQVGGTWWAPYDGAAGVEQNYEEKCGLATSLDLRTWKRLSPQGPAVLSPYASGSVRYALPITTPDGIFVYYEFARQDGSHDLRVLTRTGKR